MAPTILRKKIEEKLIVLTPIALPAPCVSAAPSNGNQLREPFVIAKLERFGRRRRIAPHGEEGVRTTPEATAS